MGNYDDGGDSAESAGCFYGIMTVGEFAAHRVGDQGLFGDPPLSRMTLVPSPHGGAQLLESESCLRVLGSESYSSRTILTRCDADTVLEGGAEVAGSGESEVYRNLGDGTSGGGE